MKKRIFVRVVRRVRGGLFRFFYFVSTRHVLIRQSLAKFGPDTIEQVFRIGHDGIMNPGAILEVGRDGLRREIGGRLLPRSFAPVWDGQGAADLYRSVHHIVASADRYRVGGADGALGREASLYPLNGTQPVQA